MYQRVALILEVVHFSYFPFRQAAISILRTLTKPPEAEKDRSLDLEFLLAAPKSPSLDTFDTISAIDLAEQVRGCALARAIVCLCVRVLVCFCVYV